MIDAFDDDARCVMKLSDLLSPTDVMIDVRASNRRLLLQEFAAKARAV
jgi:PTS system nitrogen regulatory IIA component